MRKVRTWVPAVSFTGHQAVAALDPKTQGVILRRAARERLTVTAIRQEVRKASRKTISTGSARGVYRVAYLDPEYGPKTIDDLTAFPLLTHLRLHSAVFLWCPERYRDDVPKVFDAWGVRHAGSFIWHTQEHGGPSSYLSTRHEHLLWLIRGRCLPDQLTPMVDSVVSVKATTPGHKPERFREIIDRLYDHGRKVEFFCRHQQLARSHSGEWSFVGETPAEEVA